jgi:hypothetical protein
LNKYKTQGDFEMADFDFDLLNELVEEAPQAGGGPRVNYGKCTMDVVIMAWKDENGTRTPDVRPFKKGEVLKNGEYLQITFNVDLQEFNPALEFTYARRVDIRKSGPRSKTDWSETVEPSLLKIFGKEWSKKIGKGVYVEVEDVETVVTDKEGKPKSWTSQDGKVHVNTAPRFLRAFKSKAECMAAREERFGKKEIEFDFSENDGDIPASVIKDTKGLIASLGEEQARKILAGKPLGDYEPDALIAAATA